MKKWSTPMLEALDLNKTAAGGHTVTTHDGLIYNDENGLAVEQYNKLSGE